jgi:lysozyme
MRTTQTGIKMIHYFEKCVLKPYLCPAGVPTIGWGNTFYPNGKKVTMKDKPITQAYADQIFIFVLSLFEKDVASLLKVQLKPHQFDALVSFAYNVGTDIDVDEIAEGLGDSTLLKIVNANPNSDRIPGEFAKWNRANGKVMPGLVTRRRIEANYYTTGILKFK